MNPAQTSSPAGVSPAALARGEALFGRFAGSRWAMPAAIGLAVLAFVVALAGFNWINRMLDRVSVARSISVETVELRIALVDAETGMRGYALTGDALYLQPHTLAVARMPAIRKRLDRLTVDDPEARILFRGIEANLDRLLTHWTLTIDLVKKGDPLRAQAVIQGGRGLAAMEELRQDVERLERLHEARLVRLQSSLRLSLAIVAAAVSCVILVILGLFLLLLRYSARAIETERRHAAYARDERERLERAVRDRTLELSELASHLQQVQEQERFNVARELHDEMGALLTASKMNVAWLLRQGHDLPLPMKDKLHKLEGFLEQGVQLKRKVIEGLAPSALSNLGLRTAVESLVAQVASSAGIRTEFRAPQELVEPPHDIAIAVYRAAQEALTNVQKHAKAAQITVALEEASGWIELHVEDDGRGFHEMAAGKAPMMHGVRGMRHRAMSHGGSCTIRSAPGRGTTVLFRVPAASRSSEAGA
jgi:signal transduction histidine kinase